MRTILVLLWTLSIATLAMGQRGGRIAAGGAGRPGGGGGIPGRAPIWGFGYSTGNNPYGWYDGYYGNSWGSTAASANMSSMAELVRAQGEAAVEGEKAREQALKNDRLAWDIYNQKRSVYEERQAADAAKGRQRVAAYQKDLKEEAKAPPRRQLSASQWDSATGKLEWPDLLQREEFRAVGGKIDALFAKHAERGGGFTSAEAAEVERLVKAAKDIVRANIKTKSGTEYSQAQYFLDGVKNAARG